MGIEVTGINSTAGVTVSRPRASVLVSLAGADMRPEFVPVAGLSYIYLASSAYLDSTGRFQLFAEAVAVDDLAAKQTTKQVASSFAAQDYSVISYDKAVADAVTFAESVLRTLTFLRTFYDFPLAQDQLRFTFGSRQFDSFSAYDSMGRSLNKTTYETVTLASMATRSTSKSLAITFAATDTLRSSISKQTADQASAADQAARATSKVLADAFSFAHFINRSVGRVIRDGVAMNDSADTVDGLAVQSSKGVSNVAFATDATSLAVAAAQVDVATIASVGSLVSQGYCDPTYFAEDYVGAARTF